LGCVLPLASKVVVALMPEKIEKLHQPEGDKKSLEHSLLSGSLVKL